MFLIVGLGNPEEEYSMTRHNMGFEVINELAETHSISVNEKKFKSLFGMGIINKEKTILLKPLTFMNLSGEAIIEIMNFYKIPKENLIVIYDDVDLEEEKIRIRLKGSAGSHNGMKSVISNVGTQDFVRIRVGIGKPKYKSDMINYVIGKITKEEYERLKIGVKKARNAVEEIIVNGPEIAMSKFN